MNILLQERISSNLEGERIATPLSHAPVTERLGTFLARMPCGFESRRGL
jgi:hypothetical protein